MLIVETPDDEETEYLVDVAFGGLGPISPLVLRSALTQQSGIGSYRVVENDSTFTLQWYLHEKWMDLYVVTYDIHVPDMDFHMSNWWSCTHPGAKWVNCLFVALVVNEDRHFILDSEYCVRRKDGSITKQHINSIETFRTILETVFNIKNAFDSESESDVSNIQKFLMRPPGSNVGGYL